MNQALLYIGALLSLGWGVAHLIATRPVVMGFGDISEDNRRIITMEWMAEGVALIFIGVLVALVTYLSPATGLAALVNYLEGITAVSRAVLLVSFVVLNVLSAISLFTGFRIKFLPFRLCPVILTSASILILLGVYI